MTMRIAIARLWHEANSFSLAPTGMAQFLSREWLHGAEVAARLAGTATEIGGALAWAKARGGVDLVFSRCASAPPGGPIEAGLLDAIVSQIAQDPAFDDADGIYLSLHGACHDAGGRLPEAMIASRLRARFPGTPIAASFDMHACLTAGLVRCLDAASVYRTYPHVDMDETAARALDMLARMIETGRRPNIVLRTIGRILPSFNMRTAPGLPMQEAQALALAWERRAPPGAIFAACPYGSFAYADVDAANAGVVVTAEDGDLAQEAAADIAAFLFASRGRFRPDLRSAAAVLGARPWTGGKRIAILEPSDNPLSGGDADTPGLFAAAMAADLPDGSVFAFFHDPDMVAAACAAGVGARMGVAFGARRDARFGGPVACTATVERLTDGRFVNAGPMERGIAVDLGPTALMRVGALRVIVASTCQAANDRNYFALHGLEPRDIPVLLAKAKNHFMAAFGGSFDAIVQCDTPGPAMADTSKLPYRTLPRERLDLS